MWADFYRPQRSSEGYVFTGVCLSTGEEYLTRYTPRGQGTPPDQVHPLGPGTPPLGPGTPPPGPGPPWDQVHPRDQVHPLGPGTPLDQVHPLEQTPPRPGAPPRTRYTPQDQVHPPGPGTPHEIRLLLQTVRILLECSLI